MEELNTDDCLKEFQNVLNTPLYVKLYCLV